MRILLNLYLCVSITVAWCPVTREQVVGCINRNRRLYDLDGDGALDRKELTIMFEQTIPKMYHPFVRRIGGVESTLEKCDVDKNGQIDEIDLEKSVATCLSSCWKRFGAAKILC